MSKPENEMGNTPESFVLESISKKNTNEKRNVKKHKKNNKNNNKKNSRKAKIKKAVISLFFAKPDNEKKDETDSFSNSSNMSIPV